MRNRAGIGTRLTVILGVLLGVAGAAAEGPPDLVGTWKGYRVVHRGSGAEERRDHTVTIKSVKEAAGQWAAVAVDGQGRSLPMTVRVAEGRVQVDYAIGDAGLTICLTLQGGQVLTGEARQPGSSRSGAVRLEKQAP